jgi:hypothetical protein
METKFSHEGSKAQRKQEELRNYPTSNLFMNFFVLSRLRGIFGSGLSGLGSLLMRPEENIQHENHT